MKLQLNRRAASPILVALCVVTAAVFSVSTVGCVRSPREVVSSLRGRVADEAPDEAEAVASGSSVAPADYALVDSSSDSAIRTVGFRQQAAASDVVRAGSSAPPPRARRQSENLLDTILKRRQQDLEASEPDSSLASTTTNQAQPQHSTATHRQITGSPQSSRESAIDPTAPNQFAGDFDARLARLREELKSDRIQTAAGSSAQTDSPAIPFWAQSQSGSTADRQNDTVSTPASGQSKPRLPWTESTAADLSPPADAEEAKEQIQTLLTESQNHWEHTRFHEAHEKAVQAQELAVSNRLTFSPSELDPGEVAEQIATAIKLQAPAEDALSIPGESSEQPVNLAVIADVKQTDQSVIPAPDVTSLDHAVAGAEIESSSLVEPAAAFATERLVSDGGVQLLPPVADTLPSQTAPATEESELGFLRHRDAIKSAFASLDRPDPGSSPGPVPFAKESDSTGPALLQNRGQNLRPLPLLSAPPKTEIVAAEKPPAPSNSMQIAAGEWPRFSNPSTAPTASESPQPLRIAQAPPILLDREAGTDSHSEPVATAGLHRPSHGASGSPSHWSTQALWIIGGILLLIIAMRLTSWTPSET